MQMRKLKKFFQTYFPEILLLGLTGFLLFYNSVRFAYPTGFAGLFSLEAELIGKNSYHLPDSIPYYGPGGVVFAYPPLGLYLMALGTEFLKIHPFVYMRYFPPIVSIIALIALYSFSFRFSKDRLKAIIAVLCFASTSVFYIYHATAGGIVRAPALLFSIMGITQTWLLFQSKDFKAGPFFLASIMWALAALSHFTYISFFSFTILLFVAMNPHKVRNLKLAAGIIGLGLISTSPWWISVGIKHGFSIFLGLLQTHSNGSIFYGFSQEGVMGIITNLLMALVLPFLELRPLSLIGLLAIGVVYWIAQKKLAHLLWLFAIPLVIGESHRFQAMIGSIAIAEALVEVGKLITNKYFVIARRKFLLSAISILFLLFIPIGNIRVILFYRPSLDQQMIELGKWFQNDTQQQARFLYVGGDIDQPAEWLPMILRRSPAIGHWGAEWNGTYEYQRELMMIINACGEAQDWSCVLNATKEYLLQHDYIIIPTDSPRLILSASADPGWKMDYKNSGYYVFSPRK